MRVLTEFKNFLRISPGDDVAPAVARHFKHNFIVNVLDVTAWLLGDSFVSVSTIMPVFMSTLTDSPLLIGLVPAIMSAGWFLPQLFMAGLVERLPRKLPFAKVLAINERLPYFFLPLLALWLPRAAPDAAIWVFVTLLVWRGLAAGLVALPWQEVIASVIPISHRGRFFGTSHFIGQISGMLGSAIATLIFSKMIYPYNYAVCFFIGMLAMWLSYLFFTMNIEPENSDETEARIKSIAQVKSNLVDFKGFGRIIKEDSNFRFYLISRSLSFMGNMASGFIAVYGIKHFGLADEQVAIFTGLLFLSGIVGYALWGVLGDRVGPKRILLVSGLVWMAALVVALMAQLIWVYYAVFLLLGLAQAGTILGDMVLVMELGDEARRPTYLGLARTLPGVFLLAAPLIGGGLVSISGYPLMFSVSLFFSATGLVLLLKVKDRKRV